MPLPFPLYWVHIVSLSGNPPSYRTVATCILDQGRIQLSGDAAFLKNIPETLSNGEERVSRDQGIAYLELLSGYFHSPYLFSTEVQSGSNVLPYTPGT